MAFLQVIVNSVLILIGETERLLINNNGINNTNLTTEYRLPDYIQPIHYTLNIQFLNEQLNNFTGDISIYIKVVQPTWNISLHAQLLQIKIKNITFMKLPDVRYVPIDNITLTYSNESNILIFQFCKEVLEGNYHLKIQFDTVLHDGENIFKTFLVNEKGYTSWFLVTSFQAIGARQLFPCLDDPKFKAVFSINIKHHRSETTVVYDNEVDSIAHKREIAHLIAREMIHQWSHFRMNSASWWSYHWLYEGFATLFGADIVNQIYPESRMTELYVVQTLHESLRLDIHSIMQPLTSTINKPSEINSLFSFSYYIKAPNIMRMLRYLLTDDVFYEGLNIFFKKRSATLDDFWDAMQTAHNKTIIHGFTKKFNIKEKLNPWALQKHYPILEVREQENDYLNISVANIDSLELDIKWWIPLTIAAENHSEFISQWYILNDQWITLSGAKFLFPHQLDEWIIVNLQQTGYYRVNYEANNWLKIAKYLNKENFTNIHVLNRAQIIDDAYHFTMNGQLNSSIFFELIKYLSQEKDYVAWYPMFKALEDISTILQFPDKKIDELKINLMNNLFELLLKIKYDESPQDNDLTKCLRYEAAKWLCLLGDTECWMIANSKLINHLANSTEIK
ncbi:hypothetical protein ACFW04_001007 [Cataglyphis niger]